MKKTLLYLFLIIAACTSISGCNSTSAVQTPAMTTAPSSATPLETRAYTYKGLEFSVSGVISDRKEVYQDDGGADVDLLVITCAPNAELTITEPDMNSGEFTELGEPYPQWGLNYKSKEATGEKVRIDDKTGTVIITEDLTGIYNLEASLYIVKFEISE